MRGIYINRFVSLAVAFLIFTLGSSTGIAVELIVQPGESIQDAVNNTSSGDVVIVEPGNYTGSIMVSTENLTIRSDSGNPEDTIVTANNPGTNVFHIRADNTTVSGFKVRSAPYSQATGVYLTGCSYCDINNNDFSENYLGLYLSNSKNNTISDNKMNLSGKYGIQLMHSEGNILSNNSVDSNHHGFVLENNCSYNNLTGNVVGSNLGFGFYLINSSNNNLNNNTISRNDMGIYLTNSNVSMISGNNFSENIRYGMWISHSNYSTISGNTVKGSHWGIRLNNTDNSTLSGNILAFNYKSGLSMCPACDNNTIFNNYLNNTLNVHIGNRRNTWNTVKKAEINIVGGPYMGGNFWANPTGTDFSQTAPDKDENGIADVKYNGTNFTDYLPLVPVPDSQQAALLADLDTDFIDPDTDLTDSASSLESSDPELADVTASKITENPVPAQGSSKDDNVTQIASR